MREADIQAQIMEALSRRGHLVFRNNTGVLKDARGVPVRFGLCVGSSDLIGVASGGSFLAVEVKDAKGRMTHDQVLFLNAVRKRGGRAGMARDAARAVGIAEYPNDRLAIIKSFDLDGGGVCDVIAHDFEGKPEVVVFASPDRKRWKELRGPAARRAAISVGMDL